MASTQAQATQFADLKSTLCATLRRQVQDAYEEAKDRDQDGNRWKWGAKYYKDGDADEDIWKDMLRQWSDPRWVGAGRISSDPRNVWWIGPCGSFYDHMTLAGGELGNIIDVEDAIYCFRLVVESFEKGGLFVTWREPVPGTP
jgi:hypothetical protein